MMTPTDLDALLTAFAEDEATEDALIAELDRRYEAARAAGTLPNTDAAFARFMKRLDTPAETVAVVFRRYLMATGQSTSSVGDAFNVADAVTGALLVLRTPFHADDVAALAHQLANDHGGRFSSVNLLLKELAAHHFARVSKAPMLLAARKWRPS